MAHDLRKQIKLGPSARKEMMEGIDTLADAVVSTLGPNGRKCSYPLSRKRSSIY